MKRSLLVYVGLLVLFGTVVFLALRHGQGLPAPVSAYSPLASEVQASRVTPDSSLWSSLRENFRDPLSRLLFQVVIIVLATRLVGSLFARWGQPAVVGEVLAGILLGPSLLGWLWPGASDLVFPRESMGMLKMLGQIGVCLFMFVVGLELEVGHLRQKAQTAVLVSHVSIVFPFALGVLLAMGLYSHYAAPGTAFTPFALFMGIALSITAFPVLARILKERGIEQTTLGATAIACAAIDDATAWAILAFVVAIARATSLASTTFGLGLVLTFVALMFLLVRPALRRWLDTGRGAARNPGRGTLGTVLVVILASSLVTE